MRRFLISLVAVALVVGALPSSAFAWWKWNGVEAPNSVLVGGMVASFPNMQYSAPWFDVEQFGAVSERIPMLEYREGETTKTVYATRHWERSAESSSVAINYFTYPSSTRVAASDGLSGTEATRVAGIIHFRQAFDFTGLANQPISTRFGVYTVGVPQYWTTSAQSALADDPRPKGAGYFPAFQQPASEWLSTPGTAELGRMSASVVGEYVKVYAIAERPNASSDWTVRFVVRRGRGQSANDNPEGKSYTGKTMPGSGANALRFDVGSAIYAAADYGDEPALDPAWVSALGAVRGKVQERAMVYGGWVENPDDGLVAFVDDLITKTASGVTVEAGNVAPDYVSNGGSDEDVQTPEPDGGVEPPDLLGLDGGWLTKMQNWLSNAMSKTIGGVTGLFAPVSLLKDFLEE